MSMQPAMAIVGTVGKGAMELRLDYAIPRFRDYRMGRFLYDSNAAFFLDKRISTIDRFDRMNLLMIALTSPVWASVVTVHLRRGRRGS